MRRIGWARTFVAVSGVVVVVVTVLLVVGLNSGPPPREFVEGDATALVMDYLKTDYSSDLIHCRYRFDLDHIFTERYISDGMWEVATELSGDKVYTWQVYEQSLNVVPFELGC